jgi:hypothetical protein
MGVFAGVRVVGLYAVTGISLQLVFVIIKNSGVLKGDWVVAALFQA